MTEYQLSQWISQLLAGELSEPQRAELQAALEHSPASRAFAEWSSRIQAAAAQWDPGGEAEHERSSPDSPESLSEFSKARMRRAVCAAHVEYQNDNSQQPHLLVAQSPAAYSLSHTSVPPHDNTSPDNRTPSKLSSQQPQDALIARARLLRERLNSQLALLAASGLAIAETDIDRLLRTEIVAMTIKDEVLLIDRRGQILFSSLAPSRDELGQFGSILAAWDDVLRQSSDSSDTFYLELGIWVATLTCPAPLDSLRLVLRPSAS